MHLHVNCCFRRGWRRLRRAVPSLLITTAVALLIAAFSNYLDVRNQIMVDMGLAEALSNGATGQYCEDSLTPKLSFLVAVVAFLCRTGSGAIAWRLFGKDDAALRAVGFSKRSLLVRKCGWLVVVCILPIALCDVLFVARDGSLVAAFSFLGLTVVFVLIGAVLCQVAEGRN